jgi:serine/threonine-protein kinase
MQRLHRGHWCEIYAAQPADAAGSPRSDYAVKVTRSSGQEDPEAALQIRTEAAVAAAARHRHLIPLLDGQVHAGRPYVVMPRLSAQPLATVLRSGPQPLPVAFWWTRQCAQALQTLHRAGWIHGDLKPDNLLVDRRGHVTVIDLGLAQRIGTPRELVAAGPFRGTPRYAAPEMLAGSYAAIHPAADIFGLGRVLSELLGDKPALPEAAEALLASLRCEEPEVRPSAAELSETLLKLEIDTLHLHIRPDSGVFGQHAA